MELLETIMKRRSIRQFDPDEPVSEEFVERILNAAVNAPSAGNGQCWHFEVVRDSGLKHKLSTDSGHQLFIQQAPVVIVVCADLERAEAGYGTRGKDTYVLQETAAATENILLTVTAFGLGACWVGAFDERAAANILNLPAHLRPVAMIPIGKPAEPAKRVPPRRALAEVVNYR